MTDLFIEMVSGEDLFDRRSENEPLPALGLVVGAAAINGHVLAAEALVMRELRDSPCVLFCEENIDGEGEGTVFSNAQSFAGRMALAPGALPSEQQALDWIRHREITAFQKHLARIKAAYAEAYAKNNKP
jgi:hypothetical protein